MSLQDISRKTSGNKIGHGQAYECPLCGDVVPKASTVIQRGIRVCVECVDDIEIKGLYRFPRRAKISRYY